ncbi:MAG: amidohydrolase family protein [Henriciella sp.]
MIRSLILAASAAAALTFSASAQDMAIVNAKVWTGTNSGTLNNATIIVIDGQISGVGQSLAAPSNMRSVDAEGNWVTPGLISSFARIGLVEVGAEDATNDTSAPNTKFSAALKAADGFNPAATTIPITRIEGLTRLAIAPSNGASLIAGQGFIAAMNGAEDSVTDDEAFIYIDLGEGGAALSGGSRPAAWASLRGAFADARGYPARFMAHNDGDTLTRRDAQALGPAVRGEQLIMIAAHRASDLRSIIALKEENPNLDLVILGADEGWIVADELADADIPVIIDPFSNLPSSFAQLGATSRNAERLIAAGVKTAFAHFGNSGHQARLLPQSAGNAVANGVSFDDAMAAMTTIPADIFGLDGVGTIQPGNTADLVLWDGDPLEVMSAPRLVLIDGEVQSQETRQTKLRDRYLDLDESDRPLAFKR